MKSLNKKRVFSASAGVIAALVILNTQLSYVQVGAQLEQKTETEQQSSSSSSEHSFISLPSSFSMPSAHIVLSHEFTFIEELSLRAEQPEAIPMGAELLTGKLFRTLFQFIISPNAP